MFRAILSLAAILLPLVAAAEPKIQITGDKPAAVYQVGEKVEWKVAVKNGASPVAGTITYAVRHGGLEEAEKASEASSTGELTITARDRGPGLLFLEVKFKPEGEGKEIKAVAAAVVAPEKIAASAPPPDDFDAFWNAKIAELDAVPMNVKLEPVDIGDKKIEYFKVTMDNIRGRKIYGQLAKPVGAKNFRRC
jgi:cephalosporin-C deacetylase